MTKQADAVVFTQSRLNTFLECERKEWFMYQAGRHGVVPTLPEAYFLEGEFGHYALKHFYTSGRMLRDNMMKRAQKMIAALGSLPPEVADDYNIRLTAMMGACLAYKEVYRSDLDKYEVLAVEEQFAIEIGGVPFEGRLDLVLREKKTGKVGFVEHKFLQRISPDKYGLLPLNLQQLVYTLGAYKILKGVMPDWYMWNIIRKSALRRRQGRVLSDGKRTGAIESLAEFEARVAQQYMDEPAEMLFRPPPRKVQPEALKAVEKDVAFHVKEWQIIRESGEMPPMRYSSCESKYDQPCVFAQACMAVSVGHGEGWDAPECRGLYRAKKVLHPELEKEEENGKGE